MPYLAAAFLILISLLAPSTALAQAGVSYRVPTDNPFAGTAGAAPRGCHRTVPSTAPPASCANLGWNLVLRSAVRGALAGLPQKIAGPAPTDLSVPEQRAPSTVTRRTVRAATPA